MYSRLSTALSLSLLLLAGPVLADPPKLTLDVASTFPTGMPLIGEGAAVLAAKVERVSGGEVIVKVHEPGALMPAADTVKAVGEGRVAAAWAGAGWFAGTDPAFNMFSSVPFGPT